MLHVCVFVQTYMGLEKKMHALGEKTHELEKGAISRGNKSLYVEFLPYN